MTTPDINLFNRESFGVPPSGNPNFPDGFDISYLLPKAFLAADMWKDLLESMAQVIDQHVHTPIVNLSTIRVPESQGRVFKNLHAKMMGYPMPDHILSDDGYDRLNNNVGLYLYEQGKDSFISFLGHIAGMKLALVRLWTRDYVTFRPSPGGAKTIFEGGEWYPTTHVGVIYDENDNVSSQLPMTESEIVAKFYEEAPIDLVLAWIAKSQTLLLGTLYIQLMTHANVHHTTRVDARGDLVLSMSLYIVNMSGVRTHSFIDAVSCENELMLTANCQPMFVNTFFAASTVKAWSAGHNLHPNFWLTRRGQAMEFTDAGESRWKTGAVRVNHDPVSGAELGIFIEPDSINLVRSSMEVHRAPWIVKGAHIADNITAIDGSTIKEWTSDDGAYIYQNVNLPPGDYSFQMIGNNCTPELGRVDRAFSVETGLPPPSPEFEMIYTTTAMPMTLRSRSVGGGLTAHDGAFSVSASITVMIKLPLAYDTVIYYVGIEPRTIAPLSPIPSDDCSAGARTGDYVYAGFTNDDGSLAFTIAGMDYVGGSIDASYKVRIVDKTGIERANIVVNDAGGVITYIDLEDGVAVHYHYAFSKAQTDRLALAWTMDNLSVNANGEVSSFALYGFSLASVHVLPESPCIIDRYIYGPYPDLSTVTAAIGEA